MLPARIRVVMPACLALIGPGLAAEGSWEEAPAFSVSAADLIQASSHLPLQAGCSAQELLEDTQVVLDDQGRRSTRYRYIFRIDQDSALESWSTVRADYTNWLDAKPVIRARVITPDGREHYLDPATIGEFSGEEEGSDTFSDRRHLKAPLPKLVNGAIVEVEILYRNHRAFSRTGNLGSYALSQPVPVNRTRFSLELPLAANLRWKLKGLAGLQPRSVTRDGRTWLTLDLGPAKPPKKAEPNQAPDQNPHPSIQFSTSPSWEAVAAEYTGILEAQLQGADLAGWVRQTVAEATDRAEILRRIVARMHKEVRYTGLEFGEASIVPRTPADTLKRGYGDCKDKSALLVALLRQAGITAHLALLRVGSPQDLEPDLPGLSAFDHAIVFVPGPPSLWIDPTVAEAPVGELPAADLERHALIVAGSAPALVKTPGTSAERNVSRELRDVFLAGDGLGRILETTEATGPAEINLRGAYVAADPKRAREQHKGYVENAFKAKDLGRLEYQHPGDLTQPFQLILEAQKVGIANTATSDASVALNAWRLVETLSNVLNEGAREDDEGEKAVDSGKANAPVPRRTDLLLWAPHTREVRWTIHPPSGYVSDSLPANQSLKFGPASLQMSYQGKADGTVEAFYRMECPKRRWLPAEVNEARAALKTFGESKIPTVVFQQVGEAFLGAGKLKEALAEFRKEREAMPASADPLVRLARAQLAAGLAETARESIQQAIQLDPTSSNAHQVQGWVLQHDWIGRQFKPGWDRKAAVAAYRRAIALDPKNRFARMNLAILLEYNAAGQRYGRGADMDESVALYRALIAEEKTEGLQENLMVVLGRGGRFQESQEVARLREPGPRRNAWLLGMEACLHGFEAATALGRTLFPDLATRRAAYLGAADVAVVFSKYPEAAQLLNEGASGASDMTQVKGRAEILAKVRPAQELKLDLTDPRDVVRSMFLTLGERPLTLDQLKGFCSEAALGPLLLRQALAGQRKFAAGARKQGLTVPLLLDITLSLTEFTMDGDDPKGYVVKAQIPGESPAWFFVERSGAHCRLVGDEYSDLARQALWHLKRGDLARARAWLDRIAEDCARPDGVDPLSGHLIRRLWEKGRQGTAEEIRLAASCTLAASKDGGEAMEAVLNALKTELPPAQLSAVLQSAASGAIQRKDYGHAEQYCARLAGIYPDSLFGQNRRIDTLMANGKWQQALEAVDQALASHPDDAGLPGNKIYLLERLGRFPEATALMTDRVARGKAQPSEFNNFAWWLVVKERVDAQALDYARKGILGNGAHSSAAHHTLAQVLAESGRTSEALEFLLKSVSLREDEEPSGPDCYLLGRIAEHLGETRAAEAFYRKVKPEDPTQELTEDNCSVLAQRRLAVLQGAQAHS